MNYKITCLLRELWERILLRALWVAAVLALVAGIYLERMHTPIWLYVLIFVAMLILARYSDRWLIYCYKRFTKPLKCQVSLNYTNLVKNGIIVVDTQVDSEVSRRIKKLNISVEYETIFKDYQFIADEYKELNEKVKANIPTPISIDIRVTSQDFYNQAIGVYNQGLELPLRLELKMTINPILWGMVIPEDIDYLVVMNYDKCPDYIS